MFTNYTKIFRRILSFDGSTALQSDLSKLYTWSYILQLGFNAKKCRAHTLGKFENIRHAKRYQICGEDLEHSHQEKDLRIFVDSELSFAEQIFERVLCSEHHYWLD